jgi:hypothetical protein
MTRVINQNRSGQAQGTGAAIGKSYFIWIALHLLVWPAALHSAVQDLQSEYWRLICVAGYFVVFFLTPVLARRLAVMTLLSCLNACLAAAALYPLAGEGFNPHILLVSALLTGETVQRLLLARCVPPALVQAACVG